MSKKNVGGRPAHEPTDLTRKQVKLLAAFGNTEQQISLVIGMSPPTLRVHYEHELAIGHIEANAQVASNLFKQATKDDRSSIEAAKFWLRCRAGWSEYAPAPGEPKLGKKEVAQREAHTAGQNSEWGNLVH